MSVHFSSVLNKNYKESLENLLFFNPQQSQLMDKLVEIIEEYGSPQIRTEGDQLRIHLESFAELQTLYAFDGQNQGAKLIGIMVYVFSGDNRLVVLHLGVSEDYSVTGKFANEMLVSKFIMKLRSIAQKIKGINEIVLLYGTGRVKHIKL
jgi:hypothetical protein